MIFLSKKLFILILFILFSCSDLFLSELDECGVPNGDNSSCVDCAGIPNGNAEDLGCGCGEDAPSGCDNECGSTLVFDECSVCGGDNSSCEDCAGIPNGDAVDDCSGSCIGSLEFDPVYIPLTFVVTVNIVFAIPGDIYVV